MEIKQKDFFRNIKGIYYINNKKNISFLPLPDKQNYMYDNEGKRYEIYLVDTNLSKQIPNYSIHKKDQYKDNNWIQKIPLYPTDIKLTCETDIKNRPDFMFDEIKPSNTIKSVQSRDNNSYDIPDHFMIGEKKYIIDPSIMDNNQINMQKKGVVRKQKVVLIPYVFKGRYIYVKVGNLESMNKDFLALKQLHKNLQFYLINNLFVKSKKINNYLIMEKLDDTLDNIKEDLQKLNKIERLKISIDIIKQISHIVLILFNKKYYYADLKLENIGYNCYDKTKIRLYMIDLGGICNFDACTLDDITYWNIYKLFRFNIKTDQYNPNKINQYDIIWGFIVILIELMYNFNMGEVQQKIIQDKAKFSYFETFKTHYMDFLNYIPDELKEGEVGESWNSLKDIIIYSMAILNISDQEEIKKLEESQNISEITKTTITSNFKNLDIYTIDNFHKNILQIHEKLNPIKVD